MSEMFNTARSFNQHLNWDISNVTDMMGMFFNAESFNQQLDWDTSNVTNMTSMFSGSRVNEITEIIKL